MHSKRADRLMEAALALEKRTDRIRSCSAVLAAAGDSTRFGSPKPFVTLGSKPLFSYSLNAILNSRYIDEAVIAVREADLDRWQSALGTMTFSKKVTLCVGGKTREESVMRAFRALSKKTDYVAFHDAARPFITTADVDRVILDAFRYGAASAGAPVVDSVKRCDRRQKITEDVDREGLFAVSTPQVFSKEIYEVARAVCRKDGFSSTDDNAYVSHAGFGVHVTRVAFNPKLTYPEDLALFEKCVPQKQGEPV